MKKRLLSLALLGLLIIILFYKSAKEQKDHDFKYMWLTIVLSFGFTMTVVEGTATPGGVTVEVLNTTEAEILSGNEHDFGLQIEQDGRWYWLERKGESANTAEAYMFSTDESRELALKWASSYGSLKPGHYRVTKWFFEHRDSGDPTDFLLTEFTLE